MPIAIKRSSVLQQMSLMYFQLQTLQTISFFIYIKSS
jgi:hypothetical protein